MEVCSYAFNDPKTVLLKLNGNKCNMNCLYCSEIIKDFRDEQIKFNFDNIINIISTLPKDTHIIFHGGEPTLIGIDNIDKILSHIKKLNFEKKPSIQTNGYLNNEWVDYFYHNKNDLDLSVSLDGDFKSNYFRIINKENSFNKVDNFLHSIDSKNIKFRCIATINSKSYNSVNSIMKYFSGFKNIKFLKLNPCFDIDDNGLKEWAITPKQYLKALKTSFNYMIKYKTYNNFKLDPITDIISGLNSHVNKFMIKCNKFYSIYSDGSIRYCDAMHTYEKSETIFDSYPKYIEEEIEYCKKCSMLKLCSGGCPSMINIYKKYNRDLLIEYCQYRIEIKNYILYYLNK